MGATSEQPIKEITISGKYHDEIEKIIEHSEQFQTVSEFVDFVLAELLYGESDLDNLEEEKLKARLQSLGYL